MWPEGYRFHPFLVKTIDHEFAYSRRSPNTISHDAISRGSNISAVWTPNLQETLINGVKQGRRQTDPKGASALSRNEMHQLLLDVVAKLGPSTVRNYVSSQSYSGMKGGELLDARRQVKEELKVQVLKGWDNQATISKIYDGAPHEETTDIDEPQ